MMCQHPPLLRDRLLLADTYNCLGPILLKNSLESERLVAMLKARRSRGRSGE